MRRNYWVVVANVLVLTVVAGCRDSLVSPSASPDGAVVSMMLAPEGRPSLSLTGSVAASASASFTVGRAGGVFYIGSHAVVFPANSICDPATSGYGSAAWDAPCAPATQPITITSTATVANGRTWVQFSPDLRFVPSSNPRTQVWLFLRTPAAVGATGDLSSFNILYAPGTSATLIDEAASNATLRTYVDTRLGISARVLQHFSGYTSSNGKACEPSPDNPDCIIRDGIIP